MSLISEKKQKKHREAYRKAVKHKMESAANIADRYASVYEITPEARREAHLRNMRVIYRKLLIVAGGIFLQAFLLVSVIIFVAFPYKNNFYEVLSSYFGSEKPQFSAVQLSESYIGSDNINEPVHYTDAEKPEANSFFATISGKDISGRIYYGISDQALLEGVSHVSATSLPGLGRPIMLYGYSGTYFAGLEKAEAGDEITITTNYGVYKYKISDISVFNSSEKVPYNLEEDEEKLILCTDNPFGSYKIDNRGTFCVIADRVSGPEIVY